MLKDTPQLKDVIWWSKDRKLEGLNYITLNEDNTINVPDNPAIVFIEGDGIGPEITQAMLYVVNSAVEKVYGGNKKITWIEALAGDKAEENTGERLPQETLDLLKQAVVGIKGPLGTPVGKGGKSLNSALRKAFNYYSAVRPVYWIGQPTPVPEPQKVDVVVFRENTDDVYSGIEFFSKTEEAQKVRKFLIEEMGASEAGFPEDVGITVKPMSEYKTKRHVRKALRYALEFGKKHVAVIGKGNIMKATEGAFINWAFEVAEEPEFKGKVITDPEAQPQEGQVKLEKVITDQMLMQLVLNPEYWDVIIAENLNGDYVSDLAAALIGGPGFVPSGNIGDGYALFESTHGTAWGKAGKATANPLSLTLSGAMLLEYIGWKEAANRIYEAVKKTLANRIGTPDIVKGFEKQGISAKEVSTYDFAKEIANRI